MANEIQKKDIPVDIVPDETVRALKAAQLAADAISQYRAGTVAYPFEAGTKTLRAKSLDEEKRQFDTRMAEEKRQFDTSMAHKRQQDALSLALSRSGGGGSGGGTLTERQSIATAELYGILDNIYNRNYQYGKAGLKPGEKNYKAGQYPLYYTLNDVLKNPKLIEASIAANADVKSAIDSLIRSKAGISPDKYFATPKGKELADLYYSMFPKAKTSDVLDEELIAALQGGKLDDLAW